jgi:cbb3-type cytochrome oxidase subunit 3
MRKKLKEHKFIILAIFLITGMSIAGWAFAFHYDNKAKSAGSQKELKNDNQAANVMPSTLDHSRIILLLVSTGLIGFFGVRRKSSTVKTFVTDTRSKIKLRINLLTKDHLELQ